MTRSRKLILTFVLPLTIILFGTITKWRYVYIEDGPDDFIYGFPLTFICSGWHTSMSLQIFILELLFDFSVYFITCLTVITLIDRLVKPININRYFKFGLCGLATLTLIIYGLVFSNPENIFEMKRNFKYKEIRHGYKFIWQQDRR
jgi:hypothetical protein